MHSEGISSWLKIEERLKIGAKQGGCGESVVAETEFGGGGRFQARGVKACASVLRGVVVARTPGRSRSVTFIPVAERSVNNAIGLSC